MTKREKERRNLRQLVGTNLVRLSEMNGVDLATYQELVLPRILEQVINCRDVIAQEYLMDCIIQVFPVEFHLYTLETYLASCAQLQEKVNVKGASTVHTHLVTTHVQSLTVPSVAAAHVCLCVLLLADIIIALMNKLAAFAHDSPASIPAELEMFPLFHKYSSKIIQQSSRLSLADQLQLQVALLNFSTKVYPDRVDFVDNVLGFSVEIMQKAGGNVDGKAVKLVTELLSLPMEALLLRILQLTNYAPLLAFLELQNRRDVAAAIMNAIVKARAPLDTVEKVDAVLRFITPAIKDEGEVRVIGDEDRFEFEQEQHLVARMFHLIGNEDTDVHFQLYATARKFFGQGGTQRIEYTLPALVFGSLQLALRIHAREQEGDDSMAVKTKKIFGFIHETISVLTPHFPEIALRLFMHAAQISDRCSFDAISYEYVVQAFTAYEEEIADSKAQFAAIIGMVASLQTFAALSQENWDTLVTKVTQRSPIPTHTAPPLVLINTHLCLSLRFSALRPRSTAPSC